MQNHISLIVLALSTGLSVSGQTTTAMLAKPAPVAATAPTVVPALVPYAAIAAKGDGTALTGEKTMTFLLFKDETGGEPLWTESQAVSIDDLGRYKVQLGASSASGLPMDLFASGEGRWLEVQIAGEEEQSRVLLTSVPYALKAADAATLGGLPASAFMLAGSRVASATTAPTTGAIPLAITPDATSNVTTTGGTNHYLPKFTGGSTVVSSEIYDNGNNVGIGVVPNSSVKLDVGGSMIMRGNMIVSRTNNATTSQAFPSYGFAFYSNVYDSSTHATDNPHYTLQSEPVGNNSSDTGATFNLLYSNHGAASTETGFAVNAGGQVLVGGGDPLGNGDGQFVVRSPGGQTAATIYGTSPASGYGGLAIEGIGGTGAGGFGGSGGQFFGGRDSVTNDGGDGIDAYQGAGGTGQHAGFFGGDVEITGVLTNPSVELKMDDPSDPANKYLVHSSVESSEMMTMYTGNVVTDELGIATVTLPAWFEKLNTDFRYQLTTIGRDAHAWIGKKVENGKFMISTNAAHVEVSWQITAVRQDAYAKAHPIAVEQQKPAIEKGFYMHPELYGQPAEKQAAWARHPEALRRIKGLEQARKVQH